MLLSAFPLKSHILIGNYVIFTLVHVYGFAARTFHIIVTVLPLSLLPIHNTQLKPPDTPISNIACHSSIFNRVTCMWYENVFRTKTLSFYTGANIFDLLAITNDFDYISMAYLLVAGGFSCIWKWLKRSSGRASQFFRYAVASLLFGGAWHFATRQKIERSEEAKSERFHRLWNGDNCCR